MTDDEPGKVCSGQVMGSRECPPEELGLPVGNGAAAGGLTGVKLSSLLFGPIAVLWHCALDELYS